MRTSTFTGLRPPTASTAPSCSARSNLTWAASGSSRDFVEKQRAAGGFDELAGVAFGGAGEGALLVAEQDRLHEIVGDRAAIDGDERFRLALAAAVDGAGEQFLADAGFALDQHRDGRGRGLLRRAHHARHRLAAGDDVGKGQPAFAAVADALQFALQRAGVERVAQATPAAAPCRPA